MVVLFGSTSLHFGQQLTKAPLFPRPLRHLSGVWMVAILAGVGVVSQGGFSLHFPEG